MTFEKNRRRTKRIVQFFDAAQFYQTSLNKASQEVLKESKVENPEFAKSLNESEVLWKTQLERIIEYCQDDATKAGKLIRKFIKNAGEPPLNLNPKNPISCAWYAKELIKQCIPEIKKVKSIRSNQGYYYSRPWKRWDNVGSQCYVGGRFEVFQKGSFENVYNYDINSAYPKFIAELPNPYNLHFVKDYAPEGKWSMVKAEVFVPEDLHIGPLPYRQPDTIIFPVGNWTGWFHWEELKNSEQYGVEYNIQKCLNGYEPNGSERPFKHKIEKEFYPARVKLKEEKDPRELPYKISMNSVYGVFYEKNERIEETDNSRATEIDGHLLKKEKDNPGRFFYPYFAGWVTSQTRIMILNASMQAPESVLFDATDGVLSLKKLRLEVSKKLGEWSEKSIEKARVYGNGVYELDGKVKTRGFRKDSAKDSRPLIDRMKETSAGIIIETLEKGPIHLNSSFRLRDYSMKDALTWIEKRKEMNITDCKKRIWPQFSMNDLFNKQIKSNPRKVDGNPLNVNPLIVWDGKQDSSKPQLLNRFNLGKVEIKI